MSIWLVFTVAIAIGTVAMLVGIGGEMHYVLRSLIPINFPLTAIYDNVIP